MGAYAAPRPNRRFQMSADNTRAFAPLHATNEFLVALQCQRAEYLRSLPAKVDTIDCLWEAVCDDAADADLLEVAETHAHSIAGSAGTFGFRELGHKARVLEILLQDIAA